MRTLTLLITLLTLTGVAEAQTILVNATAQVQVPADKISFRINLNARGETPQKAFDLHKQREKVLVDLLKKNDANEKDINFEPIAISRIHTNEYSKTGKEFVQTQQAVVLTLSDFTTYEKIQITLIDNDFDEFSGQFLSSKQEEGEDEALKKALEMARKKADIIAQQTGITIQKISEVNYSFNQHPVRYAMEIAMKSSDSLMDEFEQTVTISASVSVKYNDENDSED